MYQSKNNVIMFSQIVCTRLNNNVIMFSQIVCTRLNFAVVWFKSKVKVVEELADDIQGVFIKAF